MNKLIATLAVATLAVGLAGTSTASGGPPRSAGVAASPGYTPPPITWHACTDPTLQQFKAKCGMLIVPMDYAHPGGRKIELAVSRVLHTTSAADYQGVMLVNPGGPGGSGLIYSILQGFIPDNAGAAYDWIGFDPRGVGSSRPALACNANFFKGDRPPYRPTSATIHRQWVQRSKRYAADCVRSSGSALFQHVKTVDTVQDMETLRKALGRKRINYYGFSYGTYLGSVYATRHPTRVRRFVFDSTINPRRVFYKSNQDQDVAFQKTFNIYFRWLAKYHGVYHVGATRTAVRARYLATIRRLDRHAAKGFLGGDELIDVFTAAGYYVYGWEDIAAAYSRYLNQGNPDRLIAMYRAANDTSPGGDNGYAMYLGTQCTDAHWPRSQARLDRDNRKLDRRYNYFTWSNAWFNGPCAYWHYRASKPVHVTGARVVSPILMIDETFDAATPFRGSLIVRQRFPSASLIEGKNGTTHAGSLSGVACTDDSIAAYLRDGTVPGRRSGNRSDKVCPSVPRPDPTAMASPSTSPSATAAAAQAGVTGVERATALARLRAGLQASGR